MLVNIVNHRRSAASLLVLSALMLPAPGVAGCKTEVAKLGEGDDDNAPTGTAEDVGGDGVTSETGDGDGNGDGDGDGDDGIPPFPTNECESSSDCDEGRLCLRHQYWVLDLSACDDCCVQPRNHKVCRDQVEGTCLRYEEQVLEHPDIGCLNNPGDSYYYCADDAACCDGYSCFRPEWAQGTSLSGYCIKDDEEYCFDEQPFDDGCGPGKWCDPLQSPDYEVTTTPVKICRDECAPEGYRCWEERDFYCCPGLVCQKDDVLKFGRGTCTTP